MASTGRLARQVLVLIMHKPRQPIPSPVPKLRPIDELHEPQEIDTDTHVLHTLDRDALGEADDAEAEDEAAD